MSFAANVRSGVAGILNEGRPEQIDALAKISSREVFDDPPLRLATMKKVVENVEEKFRKGKVTEEEVLDEVLELGDAHMWMREWDECCECFERAKEGFVRLLGEDSAKAVNAAYMIATQIPSDDEEIAEYRRLWERAKVSLPEEAVTYQIANSLGVRMVKKGKYEEAKVFWLAALKGQRRVLGDEHKDTLMSLNNLGAVLDDMEDYEGSLSYYQQALRVKEKVLGKTHPDTLGTIMNMAVTYEDGLKDFVKSEEMKRQALDGYEKSLGKEHEDTKKCARNMAILFWITQSKQKMADLIQAYPHLLERGVFSEGRREGMRGLINQQVDA